MDGSEDLGQADGADAVKDEVEREVHLGVLTVHLLGGDVDAAAGGDDDGDGLVDGVGDGEGVDGGGGVVGARGGDAEHVDGVDEAVHDAVLRLDADDELARSGGERVVADGVERGGRGGGGGGLLLAAGEVEAREAEGGDGGEGAGDGEPGARLEEDVRAVHRLQGDREARHGAADAGGGVGALRRGGGSGGEGSGADLGSSGIWEGVGCGAGRGVGRERRRVHGTNGGLGVDGSGWAAVQLRWLCFDGRSGLEQLQQYGKSLFL